MSADAQNWNDYAADTNARLNAREPADDQRPKTEDAIAFDGVCCAFMREALNARVVVATAYGRELWLTDPEGLFEVARIAYCPWCASNVAWLLPAPPMTTEGVTA